MVGVQLSRSHVLALSLIVATIAYVILPLFVKGFHVDPAFSGLLTGIIGLASLKNGDKDPPK